MAPTVLYTGMSFNHLHFSNSLKQVIIFVYTEETNPVTSARHQSRQSDRVLPHVAMTLHLSKDELSNTNSITVPHRTHTPARPPWWQLVATLHVQVSVSYPPGSRNLATARCAPHKRRTAPPEGPPPGHAACCYRPLPRAPPLCASPELCAACLRQYSAALTACATEYRR